MISFKGVSRIEFLIVFLLFSTLVTSCFTSPDFVDDELIDNYFQFNNFEYELSYGAIDDDGTNHEITGRYYDISLKSGNSFHPTNYIQFSLLSNSTSRLQEGIYLYNDSTQGELWGVKLGVDLIYDETNNAVDGQRIDISSSINYGVIDIQMKNGDYVFEFEFEFNCQNEKHKLTGYFTDILHEENF